MAGRTVRWFLSLQMTVVLLLIVVKGSEDADDDAYKNGRNLVLEHFLPINLPLKVDVVSRREKRDVEGSGEDDFSELKDSENATRNALVKMMGDPGKAFSDEGSGDVSDKSSEENSEVTIIGETEVLTTTHSNEDTSTEMIFDKSEDFTTIGVVEETTESRETATNGIVTDAETTTLDNARENSSQLVTFPPVETTTNQPETTTTTTLEKETTTQEATTAIPKIETTTVTPVTTTEEPTTTTTTPLTTPEVVIPVMVPETTGDLPVPTQPPTTPQPVVEEIIKETKVNKQLEAMPERIHQKKNLSLAADPLLIANTRLMDSEENIQLSSSEPKRLGAYIVIGLILLSFSSLVGYITFRKRMNRKRREFESAQESNDTEKALLSLSDYKDNADLEENHLKNNEITPITVKSNTQINKFEKNTNFSSPKNLNTIANEKNIEKDNVLKSTAENLTQVIIEDSPKDLEEEKNVPNMEKLIVKTRIDQDSIPKKPIIINRSSTGYLPIPQDNS